jgi:predicted amidohydrolase
MADQPADPVTLVAVQMQVSLDDYQSCEHFRAAVERCMRAAVPTPGQGSRLVAFPEDVGLGLLFLDDYEAVQHCSSFEQAARLLVELYRPEIDSICAQYGCSPARGLLLLKGDRVSEVYCDTFGRSAREHQVTLVAGSAPIPGDDGTVHNTSFVFGPTGRPIGIQRKVHLIDLEGPMGLDLTPGAVEDIHPIDTPAGRIGVALCHDAFFSDVVETLAAAGSRVLVQPSFNPRPWDAWQEEDWKNGLWTAMATHPEVAGGVNPMMVGALWDVAVEGVSSILGGPFDPPSDGYLAQAASPTQEDIVAAQVDVPRT